MEDIVIKGARVNNLKNVDVSIPRGRLVVVTGLSGSGKSSLAFDTLFAEGQRRYVESLSSYARQFLGRMAKPEVDSIKGIAPAVAVGQKVNSTNPRSTVGTTTEIYEYLKLMFARIGRTFSPVSGREVKRHSVGDVVDFVMAGAREERRVEIYAPLAEIEGRPLQDQLRILWQEGFVRVRIGDGVRLIEEVLEADPVWTRERVWLLVDRLRIGGPDDEKAGRLSESVQTAFFEGRGCCAVVVDGVESLFSNRFEADGITFEKPNPNFFSFNNPYGACPRCQGTGRVMGVDEDLVVPNKALTVYEGAVVCWRGDKMNEWLRYLIKVAPQCGFSIHKPYNELSQDEKDFLWHGNGADWEGIDGFFRWVDSQQYKIQYRVIAGRYRGRTTCPDCHGRRLRRDAEYVKVCGKSISEVLEMPVKEVQEWVRGLALSATEREVCRRLLVELENRLQYLMEVGLGYLTLNRASNTLSGGESQRINLATSLGSSLVGSMYVLDEPSIGLHSRDTERLISVLKKLRDLGNTVVVVEHDEEIIRSADYIIDIGPGAGRLGGQVVFAGTPDSLLQCGGASLTAEYMLGMRRIEVPSARRIWRDRICIHGAYCNNLKKVDAEIPLGVLTVVTGVSGSGKTSLVKGVLYDVLSKRFDDNPDYVGACVAVDGDLARLSGVELVDQNPIGRSSRSNPATYMKAYDEIRQLYASQPLARARGYKPGWFSFNVEGGRCEHCQGEGYVTIGMQFMADVHLVCEECHGSRFSAETLEVKYKGRSVSDVLDMTVEQAVEFFEGQEAVLARLRPLLEVGLGYLRLGQSSTTLSGGEAQRVKLASYLVRGGQEKPLMFIFDEPSTGLHLHDIQKLVSAFNTLIERGHTVVVIEHHLDIVKVADWVIDMGPDGGRAGGSLAFAGTPEDLAARSQGFTARYLRPKLAPRSGTAPDQN